MSERAKCPKCGAEASGGCAATWISFACGSAEWHGWPVMPFKQSDRCRIAELEQQVATLRAVCIQAHSFLCGLDRDDKRYREVFTMLNRAVAPGCPLRQ